MHIRIMGLELPASDEILQINGDETIADIKARITSSRDVECQLYCAGFFLPDAFRVIDLPIDTLELHIGPPEDEDHASLARAGKVRGLTRKVEKLEKPKKKTGRAKRRGQRSRWPVNVV